MSKLLIALFVMGLSVMSTAQSYRIPFRQGTLWGYADTSGNLIAKPQYDSVSERDDNRRWIVFKKNKCGLVDEHGHEILPAVFDYIKPDYLHSTYNNFYVAKDKKEGYTDLSGKWILAPEFDSVIVISKTERRSAGDELNFWVYEAGAWRVIDKDKRAFLKDVASFNTIHSCYYEVKQYGHWGIYNGATNKWIIEPKYDTLGPLSKNSGYRLKKKYENYRYFANKDDSLFLFSADSINAMGRNIEPNDLFEKRSDSDRLILRRVAVGSLSTKPVNVLDISGVHKVPNSDDVLLFSGSYSYTNGNNKMQVRKEKGKVRFVYIEDYSVKLSAPFDEIQFFQQVDDDGKYLNAAIDIALIRNGHRWGIYNCKEHKLLGAVEYESIKQMPDNDEVLLLTKNGRLGIYSREDVRNYGKSILIAPDYQQFIRQGLLRSFSLDEDNRYYGAFVLFYFMNHGKVCPVGRNGIKFYEE